VTSAFDSEDNVVPFVLRSRTLARAKPARMIPLDERPASANLAQAYERRRERLRLFFVRRTGNQETAEDLLQELWLSIAKDFGVREPDEPDRWVQRVAVNLAINWVRREQFRAQFLAPNEDGLDIADAAPSVDRQIQAYESLEYLRDLLDELPPRRRKAFLLYRSEGLTLKETAKQMGVSASAARKQIAGALAFLRDRMSEAGLWP
jgi:RNA polymerase sigma factor (sigma-70 family)